MPVKIAAASAQKSGLLVKAVGLEDVTFFFLLVAGFFGCALLMRGLKYKFRWVVSTALNDRVSL